MSQWGIERTFQQGGVRLKAVPNVGGAAFAAISERQRIEYVLVIDVQPPGDYPELVSKAMSYAGRFYAEWLELGPTTYLEDRRPIEPDVTAA
jgi:hypothetical protein